MFWFHLPQGFTPVVLELLSKCPSSSPRAEYLTQVVLLMVSLSLPSLLPSFADGDILWLSYSKDFSETQQFEHLRIFLSFDYSIPKAKVKYCWGSDPSICALISFALNDEIHSETGVCPSMFFLVLRMFYRFQLVLQYPENMHNVQQCSLPQGCLFIISSNTYFIHLLQHHHQLL